MKRLLVAALLLCAAGCRPDPCAGVEADRQCLAVEVRAGAGVPGLFDQLVISLKAAALTAPLQASRPTAADGVKLPALVALVPPQTIGAYELAIVGVKDGIAVAGGVVSESFGDSLRSSIQIVLEAGGAGDGGAPPDLAPAPTDLRSVPCQVVEQTGCGAQKCTVDINSGAVQCAQNGSKVVGTECGSPAVQPTPATDDCSKGLVCINAFPDNVFNFCREFCASGADCTQTPRVNANNLPRCILELTNGKSTVCTVSCNPTTTTDCPDGTACRLKRAAIFPEYTDCEGNRGIAVDGEVCTDGCADTFSCVNAKCRKVCIAAIGGCTGGYTCQPQSGATVFGFCCPVGGC